MRPFRFPLQRVLDVKALLEKQQRARLAEAQRRVAAAEDALVTAERMHVAAASWRDGEDGRIRPVLRALNWRQRRRLADAVREQEARLEEQRVQLDEERALLLARRKERRSLEALSIHQRQRHEAEELRRQQNAVDELFNGRFSRRERREGDG